MNIIHGKNNGRGKKIIIIASKFNEFITQRLLEGCLEELARCHVRKSDITVAWVPGAFEIPVTAFKFAKKRNVHAVICLGAVIRGETIHFDLVAHGVAQGVMQASLTTGKPVIFGVLAVDTIDHAYKRSEKKGDNKGKDAAVAAIEMDDVLKQAAGKK
ncbi:MAG: 6,7-dimethyl-8-ribityllumazine synthase [Candidatus Omnitrophica bacterium]|nr:6,7-dimethyl-8-ribityllumazine synthase [Candidatus Omnitrophota bacterium]MCK5259935.1 6,7-dimethyl-8-ribityllumazine synthase [Candidatus Omnitrophota bacterium]